MKSLNQVQGCLIGGALGDALGAPVEFLSWLDIQEKYGEKGITRFDSAYGKIGAITDDTQMTMFTVDALCDLYLTKNAPLEIKLNQAYLYWLKTQESEFHFDKSYPPLLQNKELWSRRAPGATCLESIKQLQTNGRVINNTSKGCGGVMRSAPIGLAVSDEKEAYCAGKMSALITHHHVDGFIPAGALARIISLIYHKNMTFFEAQENTLEFIKKEESACGTISLWEKALFLHKIDKAFNKVHLDEIGQGWTGDEALAMSIYCALKDEDFYTTVINSVNHSGDSDSTGSITGQILGTLHGLESLPVLWINDLELCGILMQQAETLHGLIK